MDSEAVLYVLSNMFLHMMGVNPLKPNQWLKVTGGVKSLKVHDLKEVPDQMGDKV